jgi:archaetidylinositol phosphate synthase
LPRLSRLPERTQTALQRINETITSRVEKRILNWFCERLPRQVTSDTLTAIGVIGGALTLLGFALSNLRPGFLWLACLGLVLNWFGDSLDGTLARYRKAERPTYGFFLDHMTDSFVMTMVAVGAGLSPYVSMESALAILVAYLLMTILTMVSSKVSGVFRISYNGVGPTEIRLAIIALGIAAYLFPTPVFTLWDYSFTLYDAIMYAAAAALVTTCVLTTIRTVRALAIIDPPKQ